MLQGILHSVRVIFSHPSSHDSPTLLIQACFLGLTKARQHEDHIICGSGFRRASFQARKRGCVHGGPPGFGSPAVLIPRRNGDEHPEVSLPMRRQACSKV